jgi:hypothetical protein
MLAALWKKPDIYGKATPDMYVVLLALPLHGLPPVAPVLVVSMAMCATLTVVVFLTLAFPHRPFHAIVS